MAALTAEQQRTRRRIERLIRLAEPALNAVLLVGDRVSRLVSTEDVEHLAVPARAHRQERVRAGSGHRPVG